MNSKTHIVRQTERLKRGEINRRRFIMSALATGVTLPTATALATQAEAAQPKTGGILRIGVADRGKLAEYRALSTGNTLLEIGSDGELVGDLAASFEPDKGAKRWVIELRRDITFWDGTPFDSSAVAAFLSQADTPGIRNQIASVTADGAHTIVIDLHLPNPGFAWALSDPALAIQTPSGAGTGSYVADVNDKYLQQVPHHWKPNSGHFEALELSFLPDPVARLTALLNGEIDLMDDVDPGMFGLLTHSPDLCLIETEDAALYGFACPSGIAAEASVGLGRALGDDSHRRDLAQKVLLGHGRARGAGMRPKPSARDQTMKLAPDTDAFPGAREMVSFVAQAARAHGVNVEDAPEQPHITPQRQRLRPTLDWTLSEILATRPDATLENLILKVRKAQSAEETTQLQEDAFAHLERQGHIYPLIANAIDAHRAALVLPKGQHDPFRVTQRGWFA